MRLGSNHYFEARNQELKAISDIVLGTKSKAQKFGAKIMTFFRRMCFNKKDLQVEIDNSISIFKTKALLQTKEFNEKIDRYIQLRIIDLQENVFLNFKRSLQPVMNASKALSGGPVEVQIALNDLRGVTKADVLKALKTLPSIVKKHNSGTPNSKFDLALNRLNEELEKAKPILEKDLNLLERALKGDFTDAQHLLSDDEKKLALRLPDIKNWAEKMKEQRTKLIASLPKGSIRFKYFGFYVDQINEVKRVSGDQMREIESTVKLNRSAANFIIDCAQSKAEAIAAEFAKWSIQLENGLFIHPETEKSVIEKAIAECRVEINKINSKPSKNLEIYRKNKDLQIDRLKLVKSNWKRHLRAPLRELSNQKKLIQNVGQKDGQVLRNEAHALLQIDAELEIIHRKIVVAKQIYELKRVWDLLKLDRSIDPLSNKINAASTQVNCMAIIENCQTNIKILDEILEFAAKVPNEIPRASRKELDLWVAKVEPLRAVYLGDQKNATDRQMDLGVIEGLAREKPPNQTNQEAEFLMSLKNSFDLVVTDKGPNSLFQALALALPDQVRDAAALRVSIYQFLCGKLPLVSEALYKEIVLYAETNEPKSRLYKVAPEMHLMYQSFRREYLLCKTEDEKDQKKLDLMKKCQDNAGLYIKAMVESDAYPGFLERAALAEMLGICLRVNGVPKMFEKDKIVINLAMTQDETHFDYLKNK